MRNLSLIQTTHRAIHSDSFISAVALDLDENVTYVATEHQTPDADVTVQVRKVESDGEHREVSAGCCDYGYPREASTETMLLSEISCGDELSVSILPRIKSLVKSVRKAS